MIQVDEILYNLIKDKLAEIKSNPLILNQIFEGNTVAKITQIKQFILSNEIRVVMHHPRDATDLPCFAIILEGSTESQQTIGESGDDYSELPVSNMEDGWIGSDSLLLASYDPEDPIHPVPVLPSDITQMYSALETKDGHRSCHLIAKKKTSNGKGIFIDFTNSVLEGGYVSLIQMKYVVVWIKSNRTGQFLQFGFGKTSHGQYTFPITITEKNVWERIKIDISSISDTNKDKVRYMSFKVTNDDVETDIYIDKLSGELTSLSVMEEVFLDNRYRIETWSNNAELTLMLHTILLWLILRYRTYLESSWGLLSQRVDGADIMPQPDFYPEFVYVRALIISCTTVEIIPRETDLGTFETKIGKTDYY